ncbi:SubName: Full=Uncharacterized protein {ECO:0000313/EMBL:CCA67520.1} [Serendipita indica DSM 11827]|uniref:Uncharacterized protein n=1 Tax=Serendipita indica (strain DSM 11827) TaxID=1109443 RepID=G4T896_SERID|nr:SubName: Full=Uncharacterized protein {ECO:0000313/EMBL:CCA67520.1} [Serendipita indica DSM 11827]CCA67520.1 hypothetical protein PIIN_01349 [Serendipita indica DSM 11827]
MEVVKANRLQERFLSLNKGRSDIEAALSLIGAIHNIRAFADTDIVVREGKQCDLLVSVTHSSCEWIWELDHVGHKLGSSILSQHLIIPLVLTSGFAFNHAISTPPAEQNSQTLEHDLDRFLKVSKRNPYLSASQAFRRPRMSTSISRVTAVINSVEEPLLPAIIVDLDAVETSLEDQSTMKGVTFDGNNFSQTMQSHDATGPIPKMDEETLYTGPIRETRQASRLLTDDFETQKEKGRGGESEKAPRRRHGGSHSVADDSEEEEERSAKRPKMESPPNEPPTKELSGSTTEDSDEEMRRRPGPVSRRGGGGLPTGRVKQPIKRGGRRL